MSLKLDITKLYLIFSTIFICAIRASQVNVIPVCNCATTDSDRALSNLNITLNIAFDRGSSRDAIIQSNGCGLTLPRDQRIEYGDSYEGEFPWFTSIYKANFQQITFKCAATLISKSAVLTSAACVARGSAVRPEELLVFVGAYHFIEFGGHYQQRKVKKVILHPQHVFAKLENDVAILKLASNIRVTDYVRPVCLWSGDPNPSSLIGRELIHPGWDYNPYVYINDKLTYISLPVVPKEKCVFPESRLSNFHSSKSMFCATFHAKSPTCKGDDGSGVFMNYNGVWYIRGIDSASIGYQDAVLCDDKHFVPITDIVPFLEFIRQYV